MDKNDDIESIERSTSILSIIDLKERPEQEEVEKDGDSDASHQVALNPNLNKISPNPVLNSSIHFQSEYEPLTLNRCWTIRDFRNTVTIPKLLKSLSLKFPDTTPKVAFRIKQKKSGILVLKPLVDSKEIKEFGDEYVKYGCSVGPHKELKVDFTLESPTIQVKNLNKSRLHLLETKTLKHSYLVDGSLNLIIRFTTLKPITSPVKRTKLSRFSSSKDLVKSCSEFLMDDMKVESDDEECDDELDTKNNYSNQEYSSSIFFKSPVREYPYNGNMSSHDHEKQWMGRGDEKYDSNSNYGWIKDEKIDDPVVTLGRCWDRDHPIELIEVKKEDEKDKASIPRALSSSKVIFEAKDKMGWSWDASTIYSDPSDPFLQLLKDI